MGAGLNERFRSDERGEFRIPDLDAEGERFLLLRVRGFAREILPLRGRLVEGDVVRWNPVLRPDSEDE